MHQGLKRRTGVEHNTELSTAPLPVSDRIAGRIVHRACDERVAAQRDLEARAVGHRYVGGRAVVSVDPGQSMPDTAGRLIPDVERSVSGQRVYRARLRCVPARCRNSGRSFGPAGRSGRVRISLPAASRSRSWRQAATRRPASEAAGRASAVNHQARRVIRSAPPRETQIEATTTVHRSGGRNCAGWSPQNRPQLFRPQANTTPATSVPRPARSILPRNRWRSVNES